MNQTPFLAPKSDHPSVPCPAPDCDGTAVDAPVCPDCWALVSDGRRRLVRRTLLKSQRWPGDMVAKATYLTARSNLIQDVTATRMRADAQTSEATA